jgi:ABC-type multidrug transport system ATPase subunit
MPIVELQDIRKIYDTKVAVEGLTLNIEPGTCSDCSGRTVRERPAPSA